MTKEQFLEEINFSRYPKYTLSQIKEGKPKEDCASIICTASGRILLAKWEYGKWQQAHFTSTRYGGKQEIYYTDIDEGVIFWTDEKAKDYSNQELFT